MDSDSLCSLTHTSTPISSHTTTDSHDDDEDVPEEAVPVIVEPDNEIDPVPADDFKANFNFQQFMDLAKRVIDEGDEASWRMMDKLHQRWSNQFHVGQQLRPHDHGTTLEQFSDLQQQTGQQLRPHDHGTTLGQFSDLQQQTGQQLPTLAPIVRRHAWRNVPLSLPTMDKLMHPHAQHTSSKLDHTNLNLHLEAEIGNIGNIGNPKNGEILVRPSLTIVEEGAKRWLTTAVGYLLGKNPYFHHLKAFATSTWPALKSVTATSNGFYFFQFKSTAAMEEVIEGGPWLFQGQPIVLQRWEPGMALRKQAHKEVPIWIRLRHLPMEFWTLEGLSTIASGIGKPLYQDAITRDYLRIDYARVCVMLNYNSTLPKHIIVMQPVPGGGKEIPCKIDIEYEWIPQKCITCECLGHNASSCIVNRKSSPPVKVYVQKPRSNAVDPKTSYGATYLRTTCT
ncbi:UNVERIFIED_CONTAM: hypothetical protein Sradi_7077800 [Sesamum radiatum]|uniref:DUF4283 domain-containing protein n=1 Tax=Sesamum radiatum TaxID=300843 RepID=A0AAW2J3N3_SESRA